MCCEKLDFLHDFSVAVLSVATKGCILCGISSVVNVVFILLAYCTRDEMFEITITPIGVLFPVGPTGNYLAKGCYFILHLLLSTGESTVCDRSTYLGCEYPTSVQSRRCRVASSLDY